MGRKLVKGHWRDDGVAFDWVLSRKNAGGSGTVKDNEVREVAEVVDASSPRTGERQDQLEEERFIPLETQTTPLSFLEPSDISGPAQNTVTGPVGSGVSSPQPSSAPQMQQPSQESQSGEKIASSSAIAPPPTPAKYSKAETKWGPPIIGKPPARGRINRIYKYDIPVPKSMKVGDRFAPEFQAWKLRHRDEACCFDTRGCPTREAFLNHNSAATCDHLSMKIVPIDMSNPDSWPVSMFPDQVSVPIPASITPGEEFDAWSAIICDRISEPDWRGRPTRWVRPLHIPSSTGQFKIKLRTKTREEIESYNGPAIFPSQASPLELSPKAADKVDNPLARALRLPRRERRESSIRAFRSSRRREYQICWRRRRLRSQRRREGRQNHTLRGSGIVRRGLDRQRSRRKGQVRCKRRIQVWTRAEDGKRKRSKKESERREGL